MMASQIRSLQFQDAQGRETRAMHHWLLFDLYVEDFKLYKAEKRGIIGDHLTFMTTVQ